MKKFVTMMLMAVASMAFAGSTSDTVFMVGTNKGEFDTYSDGTPVNDGEKYALVWTTNNVEFAGFNCDGTLVDSINSKVIVYIPAKNNHLKKTLVQISSNFHNPNGTYSMHLLDTRVKNIHTGEYDFIDNDQVVTNIREYVTMAIDYKYKTQFEHMPMLSPLDTGMMVANGYVEPEVLPPPVIEPVEPIIPIAPTNMVAEVEGEEGETTTPTTEVEEEPKVEPGEEIADNEPIITPIHPNNPITPVTPVIPVVDPIVPIDQTPTQPIAKDDPIVPPPPTNVDPTPVEPIEEEEPVISGYLPERFTKNLVRNKWKSMYKKLANEEIFPVFKKKYVRTSTYKQKTYVINYKIYNLVPESYLDVCETKKYINRFSEHWVIDTVFVMEKIDKKIYSVTSYEIDENFGMIEFDYFECTSKERSKVLKALRKIGLQ